MSRYMSASVQSLASLGLVAHRYFVDIAANSTTFHVCNGYRPLFTMGNTYAPMGLGEFAGIDTIKEESDPFPQDLTFWAVAVNSAEFYDPMSETMFNKQVTVYETFLDTRDFTLVSTPDIVFQGNVNQLKLVFNDSDKGTHYEMAVSSELRREPPMAYFNSETLKAQYSGDTFYDLMYLVPSVKSQWGQQDTQFSAGLPYNPGQYTAIPGGPSGPVTPHPVVKPP